MFTPLSRGSERAQDKLWDRTSPRRTRIRPPLPPTSPLPSRQQPFAGPGSSATTSASISNPQSKGSPVASLLTPLRAGSAGASGSGSSGVGGGGVFSSSRKGKERATAGVKTPSDPPRTGTGSTFTSSVRTTATRTSSTSLDPNASLQSVGLARTPSLSGPALGAGGGSTLRKKGKARRQSFVDPEEDREGGGVWGWARLFFRPGRKRVEGWMDSFWKRHFVLVVLPCMAVWIWVAMPFPVSDPYTDDPFPDIPSWPIPKRPKNGTDSDPGSGDDGDRSKVLPLDVNFYFFLFWYFGMYLAVALFFITNLFSLYRLNWWPSRLGGKLSYTLSWSATLLIGLAAHHLDLFYLRQRWDNNKTSGDQYEWERKTFWVMLSFLAMLMPAVACFSKLKRDKRHTYRHAVPAVSRTFFGQSFSRRFPASWLRFLWFMTSLAIACFSLIAGQAYASLFLTTLPHTSLDAGTWVWSWVITVQLLGQISFFILGAKVRSRALLFIYRLFFQLVYHVFYRNLFARLRSPTQFAIVQLLSSISVIIIFPLQMSRPWHRLLQIVVGYPNPWEEHVENVATSFYCRGLAQNITMVGFLGWLSILHFGPNSQIYPFFRFSPTPEDPYTFPLTFTASCAIWGSELLSSFVARQVMSFAFGVNVSQIGIDEMKEYPELVPACGWASVHVSMNILLFLIKLNFR